LGIAASHRSQVKCQTEISNFLVKTEVRKSGSVHSQGKKFVP
jgi:hypothetical protein